MPANALCALDNSGQRPALATPETATGDCSASRTPLFNFERACKLAALEILCKFKVERWISANDDSAIESDELAKIIERELRTFGSEALRLD